MEIEKEKRADISIGEALRITWDVLITVLVLTTLFAFGGIFADKHFGSFPLCTIIGFALLVSIGYPILKRKGSVIAKRLEGSGSSKTKTPQQ